MISAYAFYHSHGAVWQFVYFSLDYIFKKRILLVLFREAIPLKHNEFQMFLIKKMDGKGTIKFQFLFVGVERRYK